MEFVKKNALGILICLVIAVPAWLLGQRFEVVGGPVFAILIGMVIALFWKDQKSAKSGITYTSKKILQLAVVLLGFGMNLSSVLQVGGQSLPIIVSTIATSLIVAFALYKALHMDSNISTLIGVGSSICGGSAIAATAPVIGADDEEIAQAMITMTEDQEERERMGEAGYKRVNAFYRIEQMKAVYQDIYKGFSDKQGLEWTEEPFSIGK